MEANFPLFFGLAIQMYESTLISEQAPIDAYLQGDSTDDERAAGPRHEPVSRQGQMCRTAMAARS
jgi:cytochrome c peroxidase